MIRIGQRQFEVPLWLWLAVPFVWVIYAAYDATSFGIDYFNSDSFYLSIVRQCAVGALAGFLLADLARRSAMPWYGVLFLMAASIAASSFAINGLNGVVNETAGVVSGFAISLASSVGGADLAAFVLLIVSVAVPLLCGMLLALAFTIVSRLLIGAPLWAVDTRREFWANLGAAVLWLVVAFGGYFAIRSGYGLARGYSANVALHWLPPIAASVGALAATAVQLWLAYRFRRNEFREYYDIRVWLLAAVSVAAFFCSPGVFGLTSHRVMYDHIRPMLRAAHLLPTPEISIANYRVNVPFHDHKVFKGDMMPDGKPSYLAVNLPEEYGLSSAKYDPRVLMYRRDITLERTSTRRVDGRKQLEQAKTAEPGKDAIVRFARTPAAMGLRSDDYPQVDFEVVGFDPAVSTEMVEQALRRFMQERVQRLRN
jgi:hypothetical protein